MSSSPRCCTYILPLRSERSLVERELTDYLRWLAQRAETIVVDGSEPEIFAAHERAWGSFVVHVVPAPDLATPMGKVGGVLTGVRLASHEHLVIADDDVRYDDDALARINSALDDADVVRPQNYFVPLPWHAAWDTGRTLLNRLSGGDWPGTLGVRRSILLRTGGYDGRAMFENLELVRTVRAAGGREVVPLDLYVARRPSTTGHFWSQRVRQAYDELARPHRFALQLAMLPLAMLLVHEYGVGALFACVGGVVVAAELGRRRGNGARVFRARASLFAPAWLAERALCSWLALGSLVAFGGVPYRGRILRHAATPMRVLRARHDPAAAVSHPELLSRRRWA
jgi:Glycosyltransferase like family 2